jgi:hypothetical protein
MKTQVSRKELTKLLLAMKNGEVVKHSHEFFQTGYDAAISTIDGWFKLGVCDAKQETEK